jgi:hypothetical protein
LISSARHEVGARFRRDTDRVRPEPMHFPPSSGTSDLSRSGGGKSTPPDRRGPGRVREVSNVPQHPRLGDVSDRSDPAPLTPRRHSDSVHRRRQGHPCPVRSCPSWSHWHHRRLQWNQ